MGGLDADDSRLRVLGFSVRRSLMRRFDFELILLLSEVLCGVEDRGRVDVVRKRV